MQPAVVLWDGRGQIARDPCDAVGSIVVLSRAGMTAVSSTALPRGATCIGVTRDGRWAAVGLTDSDGAGTVGARLRIRYLTLDRVRWWLRICGDIG